MSITFPPSLPTPLPRRQGHPPGLRQWVATLSNSAWLHLPPGPADPPAGPGVRGGGDLTLTSHPRRRLALAVWLAPTTARVVGNSVCLSPGTIQAAHSDVCHSRPRRSRCLRTGHPTSAASRHHNTFCDCLPA